MVDKPDIVKKLMEDEKLGKLESSSQGSPEWLEVPEGLPEDTLDESAEFFSEDFENGEFNTELTQHGSSSEDSAVDEKELLFQSTGDLMLYLDKHGKIARINRAGIAFSGFSEDEIIGQFFWKLPGAFSKHNISKYLKVFKNTLKGKPTKNFLSELHEKSGKKHIMDFSTYPIKENNKVISVLVVAKDVTGQKEIEDRYRLITENTSDLITTVTFTLNPTFTYVSPSHKKAVGYEPSDLIGNPLFDFVHPDDKKKLRFLLKKYLSVKVKKLLTGRDSDVSEKIEIRFMDKSGNWRYMETTANPIGNEIVSVSRDVTEHRRIDERFRMIADVSTDLIYEWNVKNDTLEWFGNFDDVLGYKEDEIPQNIEAWIKLIHPDDLDKLKDSVEQHRKSTVPIYEEYRIRKKDGTWLNWTDRGTPVLDENGLPVKWIGGCVNVTERKQMEGELIEREKELRFVTESSLDTIFTLTKTGKITYVSPSSKELFGFEPNEMIGTSFTKYITKRELPKYWKTLKTVLFHKKIPGFETYIKNRNGNLIPVEIDGQTVERDGKLVAQGTIRDITERKKAEEAIQESENRFKNLFENMSSVVAVYEAVDDGNDFVFKDFNRAGEKIDGVKRKDILGKRVTDAFPGVKDSGLFEVFQRVWKTGKPEHHPVSLYKDDRIEGWGKNYVYRIPSGEIVAVYDDVTKQKKAEEEIRKAKSRMELIINTAPSGLFTVDLDRKITSWSPVAEKISGIKVEDAIGKKCTEIWDCPTCFEKCSLYDKDAETPVFGSECTVTTRKGEEFTLSKNIDLLRSETGEIVGGIESFVDITEQKKAENELKESHEMLQMMNSKLERKVQDRTAEIERLLKQKDDFIGQLGHDLKNPLGPLINLLPLLEKKATDPETKETFEILNRNARHMKNLVVNTIELARLNSPNVKLNIEDTNLLDELNNVIKRNSLLFRENNIEIENKADKDIIVQADKLRLTELFDNLISNSVKYSPDGGTITIDAKQDKDFVTVSIRDAGMGITEEQLSYIFDEFYKADVSRHDFDSSGLGLPICKRIVEKHGGKIWAERRGEGKGTTMFFTLPVSSKK